MSKFLVPLISSLFILGCQKAGVEDHAAADSSTGAAAQMSPTQALSSAGDTPSSPTGIPQYAALKAAASEFAANEIHFNTVEQEDGAPYLDVIDCSEEDRARDPSGAPTPPIEALARRIALLDKSLRQAGYPAEVYRDALDRYESATLRKLPATGATQSEASDDAGLKVLASEIDQKRSSLRPDLPAVRAVGGCGAAESETIVRSDPAGGRVWLITRFAFDVCQARRVNPWDRSACNKWSEMDPSHPSALSGEYAYQAVWPNGVSGRGTRQIAPGDDSDTPSVYLVRRN